MTKYSVLLKSLREKMLISQDELAKLLGVSFATVNRWENGHHEPTLKSKRAIRDLCWKNVSVKDFHNRLPERISE